MLLWFSGGIGVQTGRAQTMAAPAYKATFSWSLATNATVVRASTNTQVTCTVDISLTGDSYQPLPAWVMPVPSIIGAGGSTFIYTNYDYSPNWAQYVCVFTPSDPGNITLQVDAGSDSSSRAVTAVRLDQIVFSPDQVIAVSNAVTMTVNVLPSTFAGTYQWGGLTSLTGQTITATPTDRGHIQVWVTLNETGETLQTELVVLNPTLTVFAKDDPGFVGELTGFDVLVENDEGLSHTVIWSGAVTGTNNTYTPSSFGTKTATATVTVGPWTGSANADQNVNKWTLSMYADQGDIIHTYLIEGPDGCFLVGGSFTNEYDFQHWVGAGTNVVTKRFSKYEGIEYEVDDNINNGGSGSGGGGEGFTLPPPLTPSASAPGDSTDGPKFPPLPLPQTPKIEIEKVISKYGPYVDLATKIWSITRTEDTKKDTHTVTIQDVTIGAPVSNTTGPYQLKGKRLNNMGIAEEALTEAFNATVSPAYTSLKKKVFSTFGFIPFLPDNIITYEGTARSSVWTVPNLVRLKKDIVVGGAPVWVFSPLSVAPAVTSELSLSSGFLPGSVVSGDPAKFQMIRNGAAINSVNIRTAGGRYVSVIATGHVEITQDDLFDGGGDWYPRQDPPGDLVQLPEVSISLKIP